MSTKKEHEVKENLEVDVWYPDHPPRTISETFSLSRKNMIEDNANACCYICGNKTDLELHHFIIEWAFADAIDWDKVKKICPDFNWADFKQASDFVDSEYNMLVLCQKHHRLKNHGIHNLPYPIWKIQQLVQSDFVLTEDSSSSKQ